MRVPLVDLRAAYLPVREAVERELATVLEGMDLTLGPNVRAFEEEFAAYCEVPHGVAVSSGTDALAAALRACDVGPGDEVIAPAHTFFATIEAIVHTGAIPVLVDVEPDTLTIDPAETAAAIGPATKAIVAVHLYGHPADMDPLLELAQRHGLRLIEDCAQAHGARYKGRRCGSIGDAGCFSFYVTKNLGSLGEGGFVTTRDASTAEHVRLLRHHGHVSKFEHAIVGYNLRLHELQAVVLRQKLPRLDAANARRRELAAAYARHLGAAPIGLPAVRDGCAPVHHVYPLRVAERDVLGAHLEAHGVGIGIHYKIPAHRQPALHRHPHRVRSMPVTDAACAELLSIPMYPELTEAQVAYVSARTLEFFEGRAAREVIAR
jgi:dTDP-4-amino-4,6-dideoxygalactose transaminase